MSVVGIRRLGPTDLKTAQAQVAAFWDETPSEAVIGGFLAHPITIFLSAEDGAKPVGQLLGYFLPCWDRADFMLFLYSIDVDEAYQRQGIATRLITLFREIGQAAGCWEGFVFTNADNAPAMALYEKMGGVRPNRDDVMWDFAWK